MPTVQKINTSNTPSPIPATKAMFYITQNCKGFCVCDRVVGNWNLAAILDFKEALCRVLEMSWTNLSLAPVLHAKTRTMWDALLPGIKKGGHPRTFLVPLRLFSIRKSTAETFAVPFRVWGEKIGLEMSCFRIVPLTGAKHLQPCPQNRILVILRGSYQDFRQLPHPFYMGVLLWVLVTPANLKSGWDQKGRCGFQGDDNIKKNIYSYVWK